MSSTAGIIHGKRWRLWCELDPASQSEAMWFLNKKHYFPECFSCKFVGGVSFSNFMCKFTTLIWEILSFLEYYTLLPRLCIFSLICRRSVHLNLLQIKVCKTEQRTEHKNTVKSLMNLLCRQRAANKPSGFVGRRGVRFSLERFFKLLVSSHYHYAFFLGKIWSTSHCEKTCPNELTYYSLLYYCLTPIQAVRVC